MASGELAESHFCYFPADSFLRPKFKLQPFLKAQSRLAGEAWTEQMCCPWGEKPLLGPQALGRALASSGRGCCPAVPAVSLLGTCECFTRQYWSSLFLVLEARYLSLIHI